MWIFTTKGFISVVASDQEPGIFLARARNKKHLENLFPFCEIVSLPNRDYKYRVFITQEQFTALMAELATSIDYSNFKNAISDEEYHEACAGVWSVMYKYQKGK